MANDGVLESVDPPASIRITANDFLSGIPRRYHVKDGALDSTRSRGMSEG